MGCPNSININETLVFSICTHDPDSGILTDADVSPSYRVYQDGVDTAMITGTMSKVDDANTTGFYSASFVCSTANGFNISQTYSIYVTAQVHGNLGGISYGFRVPADPLGNEVPGVYPTGSAGWAIGRIGSGVIEVVNPLAQDGLALTIIRGDDYLAADGRAIDWIDNQSQWPDLTSGSVVFTALKNTRNSTLTSVGSIVNATGTNKKVRVEFTKAQTSVLKIGDDWHYDVQVTLPNSDVITLVLSTVMEVREDMTV